MTRPIGIGEGRRIAGGEFPFRALGSGLEAAVAVSNGPLEGVAVPFSTVTTSPLFTCLMYISTGDTWTELARVEPTDVRGWASPRCCACRLDLPRPVRRRGWRWLARPVSHGYQKSAPRWPVASEG